MEPEEGEQQETWIQLPPPPPSLVRVKYTGTHDAQHFPCLIRVSEQESRRAGTEQGEPPGSHLLWGAPSVKSPAPPGAGKRQAPPKRHRPFPTLSGGQGKPKSGEPFKSHLWDNAIITLHLLRTVGCQGRQGNNLPNHTEVTEAGSKVRRLQRHPPWILLFVKKKVCGLKCEQKYLWQSK